MFKHNSIADFQNLIKLVKSASQEKNVEIAHVKVFYRLSALSLLLLLVLLYSLSRLPCRSQFL